MRESSSPVERGGAGLRAALGFAEFIAPRSFSWWRLVTIPAVTAIGPVGIAFFERR